MPKKNNQFKSSICRPVLIEWQNWIIPVEFFSFKTSCILVYVDQTTLMVRIRLKSEKG